MSDNSKFDAIAFDLFETLIFVEGGGLRAALKVLVEELKRRGFGFDDDALIERYLFHARRELERAKETGVETHNRFWIAGALNDSGTPTQADDERIIEVVTAYFERFNDFVRLIPGTVEMLERAAKHYPLALLSNFTHAPAARSILERHKLESFFEVVLISDELGYRKPRTEVFTELIRSMKTDKMLYVGDDLKADVAGAESAGLRPVWVNHTCLGEAGGSSRITARPRGSVPEHVTAVHNWEELADELGFS